MVDYLTGLLLVFGSIFCLVASVGVIRLPDTLIRIHAATKAGTLGTGLLVIAEALFYRQLGISLRAATIIVLVLLTAPVAAHLIGRAFYHSGGSLSDRTWIDELRSQKGKNDSPS